MYNCIKLHTGKQDACSAEVGALATVSKNQLQATKPNQNYLDAKTWLKYTHTHTHIYIYIYIYIYTGFSSLLVCMYWYLTHKRDIIEL